jgi:cytidine deaminase
MKDGQQQVQEVMVKMAKAAWEVRSHAYILGNTRVGAAALSSDGAIFAGCNIEHRFRCHDVHAEVNAISSMVAAGRIELAAVVIVAERVRFTPCGSCMDWIFQFGGPACLVGFQPSPDAEILTFRTEELMPYYPE